MTPSDAPRLASLDAFRGVAIAGMILVNNPGSWQHVYGPLRHAEWHGFTPTDQVFPAFLFIVGAAIPFTLANYRESGGTRRHALYGRIVRRVVALFVLGLVLNASTMVIGWLMSGAEIEPSKLRYMGVLQRISLAYLLAIVLILALGRRQVFVAGTCILIGYWAALKLVPVPEFGPGNLSLEGSLPTYVDRLIISPGHLYKGGFDPEGLLSTVPAAATVLFGYAAGVWVRRSAVTSRVSLQLAAAGVICLVIGYFWGLLFPINKQLWTSSYVVFTAGGSLVLLGMCYEALEVRRWRWIGWPFQVMGVNAILLFFASGIVARFLNLTRIADGTSVHQWIYNNVFVPWAGPIDGSLAFALTTVLAWWAVLYGFYRRGWFLRL